MKTILLTGASSGIGKACFEIMSDKFDIFAPSRQEFDLEDFSSISNFDFSKYDVVVNCAGTNVGTYLGFHRNAFENQVMQVHVNFIAPVLMAKKYTQDRESGQFVYISSNSVDNPQLYNIFNSTSKLALKHTIKVLANEYTNFLFTEISVGRTKTNMLHQNYNNSKSWQDIELEYAQYKCLTADQVAQNVLYSIEHKINKIVLNP